MTIWITNVNIKHMLVQPFASPFANPFSNPFGVQPAAQRVAAPEQPRELSLPRYVNYLADYSGCGFWRILWPEKHINETGVGCSTSLTAMVFDPRWYTGVKSVKVQRQASSDQKEFIKYLKQVQQDHKFKLIYEVDMLYLEKIFQTIINLNWVLVFCIQPVEFRSCITVQKFS